MYFADNFVLVDEARDGMNVKLKREREALESKGFKIFPTKPDSMKCNFNGDVQRVQTPMEIEAQEILQKYSSWYLVLIITEDGEIEDNFKHKIRAG